MHTTGLGPRDANSLSCFILSWKSLQCPEAEMNFWGQTFTLRSCPERSWLLTLTEKSNIRGMCLNVSWVTRLQKPMGEITDPESLFLSHSGVKYNFPFTCDWHISPWDRSTLIILCYLTAHTPHGTDEFMFVFLSCRRNENINCLCVRQNRSPNWILFSQLLSCLKFFWKYHQTIADRHSTRALCAR